MATLDVSVGAPQKAGGGIMPLVPVHLNDGSRVVERRVVERRVLLPPDDVAQQALCGEPEAARQVLEAFYQDNVEGEAAQHDSLVRYQRRAQPPVRGPLALQQCCAAVQKEPAPDVAHARRLGQSEEIDVKLRHDGPAGHGLKLDKQLTVIGFSGGISSPALAVGLPLRSVLFKVNRQPVRSLADIDRELARWPSGTSTFAFRRPTDESRQDAVLVAKPGVTLYHVLRDCTVRSGKDKQNKKLGLYKKGELVEAVQHGVNSEGLTVLRTRTHCIVKKDSARSSSVSGQVAAAAAAATNDGGWVKLRSSKGRKNLEKVAQAIERHESELGSLDWAWTQRCDGLTPSDCARTLVAEYEHREGRDWAARLWEDCFARGEDPLMHWNRREAARIIQAHVRGRKTRKNWAEYGHSRPLGHAVQLEDQYSIGIRGRGRSRSRSPQRILRYLEPEPEPEVRILPATARVVSSRRVANEYTAGQRTPEAVSAGRSRSRSPSPIRSRSRSRTRSRSRSPSLNRTRSRSTSPVPAVHSTRRVVHPSPVRYVSAELSGGWRPPAGTDLADDFTGSEDDTSSLTARDGQRRRRRREEVQRDRNGTMTAAQRVAAQREGARSARRSEAQTVSGSDNDSIRRGSRRAARSPGQVHSRRRAVSRSPSPQRLSPSALNLEPAEPARARPRRTSPSPAQERQRAAEQDRPPTWRSASPERGVAYRGGGAPDISAVNQDNSHTNRSRSRSRSRSPGADARRSVDFLNANAKRYESAMPRADWRNESSAPVPAWWSIDGAAIAQLASYRKPAKSVLNTLRAALIALDQPLTFEGASWEDCKRMLAQNGGDHEGFAETLKDTDDRASNGESKPWSQRRLDIVRTLLEVSEDKHDGGSPRATCHVTGALWEWTDRQLQHQEYHQHGVSYTSSAIRRGTTRSPHDSILRVPDVLDDITSTPRRQTRRASANGSGGSSSAGTSIRKMLSPSRKRSSPRSAEATAGPSSSANRLRRHSPGSRHETQQQQQQQQVLRAGDIIREGDFVQQGGELRVRVERCSLRPGRESQLPHPFVALSLARVDDNEQKTKTAHKSEEHIYNEVFDFVVPAARTARARQQHGKYDLRAGDGLLKVDVRDARGYTPLRKPIVIGGADVDLYELFGPRGRWTRSQSANGRMTGRRLHHTCVLLRTRSRGPPLGEAQQSTGGGIGDTLKTITDDVGGGLKKVARALSPNPRPQPFSPSSKGSSRRSEAADRQQAEWDDDDDEDEWEVGELTLQLEFTPNLRAQDRDGEEAGGAAADTRRPLA